MLWSGAVRRAAATGTHPPLQRMGGTWQLGEHHPQSKGRKSRAVEHRERKEGRLREPIATPTESDRPCATYVFHRGPRRALQFSRGVTLPCCRRPQLMGIGGACADDGTHRRRRLPHPPRTSPPPTTNDPPQIWFSGFPGSASPEVRPRRPRGARRPRLRARALIAQ